jgi:AcrR family transcriptional regulator
MTSRYLQIVSRVSAERTQAERSEATTTALVEAARELFADDGYAATSLDAVVGKAGVTKGALYHHFTGKRELFAAVFAVEQERLSRATVVAAQAAESDPWVAFEAGCRAFIEACQEAGVQRIVLLDAPAAIGWQGIRELESSSFKLMEIGIQRAIDAGSISERPVAPLAHLLFGAICELSMAVARASDQREALREAIAELHRVLTSLARG